MTKTIIGTAIISLMIYFLRDVFYEALCEAGKFGCSIGWVAFKSGGLIVAIIIGVGIYYYVESRGN